MEIDVDSFRLLVEDAMSDYSKAVPFTKLYTIQIYNPRQFTFTDVYDDEIKRIPDWLAEVSPVFIQGYGLNGDMFGATRQPFNATQIVEPIETPWIYRKPTLTVPYSAKYDVTACFKHWIEKTTDPSTGEVTYEMPSITIEDQVFFKLLQAKFIQGIGRSRRAFTLNDLPILMDADQLISEGEALEEKAKEELVRDEQKFYLAFG